MFLKKIIFFEQYRGYNLLYSEAGAVGAWHDIQGNGGRYMELQPYQKRTWVEVDIEAIRNNYVLDV